MKMKTALTIAGSDSSGGAGIQADIKTMTVHGIYAMSAITALTAQNTTGVKAIMESTPEFLAQQLDAVFEDIFPDAVKTGMVASPSLISIIAQRLRHYNAVNIVVDPVMIATSGSRLISEGSVNALLTQLLPLARLVTPNIPEAKILSGMDISGKSDMECAAHKIYDNCGCAVLIKGGHSIADANDVLYDGTKMTWLCKSRIDNPNTHGTGCTLSSAIASNLAIGHDLITSVQCAKDYISGALSAQLDLGHGSGPLDHTFCINSERGKGI